MPGGGSIYSNSVNIRRAEFEKLIDDLGKIVADVARESFIDSINKNNIELTGELKSNFNSYVLDFSQEFASEIEFGFRQYGRFKDLKYLEYKSQWVRPNNRGKSYSMFNYENSDFPDVVQGMIKYIEELGLSKFKYIPGYKKQDISSINKTRAIRRLAWTLAAHRMSLDRIRATKLKKNTSWYTKAIMKIKEKIKPEVEKRMLDFILNGTYTRLWENSVMG